MSSSTLSARLVPGDRIFGEGNRAGTVRDAVSDRVEVEWDRGGRTWLPIALVRRATVAHEPDDLVEIIMAGAPGFPPAPAASPWKAQADRAVVSDEDDRLLENFRL
jgi:hypothetical protein